MYHPTHGKSDVKDTEKTPPLPKKKHSNLLHFKQTSVIITGSVIITSILKT